MVGRVKSARFHFNDTFRKIIRNNQTSLGNLKEYPEDDEIFANDHRVPLKKLLDRYRSNISKGLTSSQAAYNRAKYGANVFSSKSKNSSEWRKVVKSFFFGLNTLIWMCAILSLLTSLIRYFSYRHTYDAELLFGVALIMVTIISGASFYYQEYKSSRIMESFNDMMTPYFAMVKRDGHFKEVFLDEVTVGDIVKLTYGDIVPADIRLIECHEFYVDNSSLTGESDPKRRSCVCTDNDPMLTQNLVFYSTHAVEGHAKGIVIATGSNTVLGRMVELAETVEETKARSPIVQEINRFTKCISIGSLILGSIFFTATLFLERNWQDSVCFFTAIVVASVPEGLNLFSTALIILMASKMATKNCFVRNLRALETLASSAIICTDKTGTLTQNKMSVAHLWFNNRTAEADTSEFLDRRRYNNNDDSKVSDNNQKNNFEKTDPTFKALSRVARLCSRAKFKAMQSDVPLFRREVNGDSSEAAILRFMEYQFKNVKKYRSRYKKLLEIPFNPRTKYQIFIHETTEKNITTHLVTIKGAPEKVLDLCNTIYINGNEFILDEYWREKVQDAIRTLGSMGERLIGFADKLLPTEKYNSSYQYSSEKPAFLEEGLRFLGLMGLIDPPRASVPQAIKKCRKAGVKVVMITGDHPVTAEAIGRVVGVVSEGSETIESVCSKRNLTAEEICPSSVNLITVTGTDLKRMSDAQLQSIVKSDKEIIFARTTPEQKYKIVEAYQKQGRFVAVVGDGVNDSPALKKGDIAISMGITGTEVSKAISDIVLMDDNFESVVSAIEEGRLGFENLKKILAYSLADNIAEVYCFCACIILNVPFPLGTMAILLTVLGTDILPALSLMYESADVDLMKLQPRHPKKSKLIDFGLLCQTYAQVAVLEAVAGYFSYFVVMKSYGFNPGRLIGIFERWNDRNLNDVQDCWGQEWTYTQRKQLETLAQTSFFVAIVVMQVANLLICKTRRQSLFWKGMSNWMMNFAIIVEVAMTCGIIYIAPLSKFFGMCSISWLQWMLPVPFALFLIGVEELKRFWSRRGCTKIFIEDSDKIILLA